jgi:quercetin dioxygenase-like cupin family protein
VALTAFEVDLLADAYQLTRLLLDQTISKETTAPCVVEHFNDFLRVPTTKSPDYGEGATYSIPRLVLADSRDVAFVHLRLGPGGHSAEHQHQGTELMYVLRGSVVVQLEDSGLRVRLDQGDYIHFDARETHSAWNARLGSTDKVRREDDDVAEIFIVRAGAAMHSEAARRRGRPRTRLLPTAHGVSPVLRMKTSERPGEWVADRAGLARLLKQLAQGNPDGRRTRLTPRDLEQIAKQKGLSLRRSKIDRLQRGLSPVKATELPEIAAVFGVEPFLFQSFLFPTVAGAVMVRTSEMATVQGDNPRDDLRIDVPRRRLRDSAISVVLVSLAKGGCAPVNRHPGHELVMPLAGTIEVRFGPMGRTLSTPGYAHYRSTQDHCIANVSHSDPARFLVLRFHDVAADDRAAEVSTPRQRSRSRRTRAARRVVRAHARKRSLKVR